MPQYKVLTKDRRWYTFNDKTALFASRLLVSKNFKKVYESHPIRIGRWTLPWPRWRRRDELILALESATGGRVHV